MTAFENKLQLGNGIYTTTEIAHILGLPYSKINTWITKYWDNELGKAYEGNYSWSVGNTRAVGFHTLVEFYIMVQFAEVGVKVREVLNAHKELSKKFDTPFPFAQKKVIENIKSDGKKIFFEFDDIILRLDGSKQLNLNFITLFFKRLEFDNDMLASRFWPMGKAHKIVCDPHHKFGQPTIEKTDIQAEAIYKMYKAKESVSFIAEVYEISETNVKDAISFYKNVA